MNAAVTRGNAGGGVGCPLCGAFYTTAAGSVCQAGCPLGRGCRRLRCPRCGYEVPAPTRLTRWLDRRWGSPR